MLRVVSSAPTSEGIDVKFAFAGNPSKPLDIIAVLADDTDRSNVLRGENSGRQLQHVSVARSMTRVATVRDGGEQSVRVSFTEGLSTGSGSGHHLILFAQEPPGCDPRGNHDAFLRKERQVVTIRFFMLLTCGKVRALIES